MGDTNPLRVDAALYGERYREDFLTQYRDFVASADKISERRNAANSFFMLGNTTLIGITGYLTGVGEGHLWLVALAGMAFSVTWRLLIESYRSLNTAKFAVIHDMEQHLPLATYDAEWAHIQAVGSYKPFSAVESWVPLVFVVLHGVVACINLATILG